MKLSGIVVCVCALWCAAGAAPGGPPDARRALPALQHEEVHDTLGQYALRYVTAEGSVVSERGRLVPTADRDDLVLVYEGEYTFRGDDGRTYVTKYHAGTDGFHVDAEHLPKPPQPDAVQ